MQLGTRWPVGGRPPELPEAVAEAVSTVESELANTGTDTRTWRWTLTWLEGKPVVDLDDGTVITYDPHQAEAVITQPVETFDEPENPSEPREPS